MLSNDHSVLQVSPQISGDRLERAWHLCRARFVRLTAKGPLRFYRHDLLKQADNAYRSLCRPVRSSGSSHESLLARQVKRRPGLAQGFPPAAVNSSIRTGTILEQKPLPLAARELKKPTKLRENHRQATAKIEDQFCLEVLYRLEGDLLRFSCRRELLKLAQRARIHAFRANMLMAQIIESVRQYKLYELSEVEKEMGAEKKAAVHKYRGGKRPRLVLGLAALCIVIDVLIVIVLLV